MFLYSIIFFCAFLKFYANQKLFDTTFEILIIHKPSLGSCEVPLKIWAWSVQPFWRLLDTTNRQTIKHTDEQSVNILGFKSALRPSSILTFNCVFIFGHLLFVQNKKQKEKTFADFEIFVRAFWKVHAS